MDTNINPLPGPLYTQPSLLKNELIDLYALCKSTPSALRENCQKITHLISFAKTQSTLPPDLQKLVNKLEKLVQGLPKNPLPLQIPPKTPLPLEKTFNCNMYSDHEALAAVQDALDHKPLPKSPSKSSSDFYYMLEDMETEKRNYIDKDLAKLSPEMTSHLAHYVQAKRRHQLRTEEFEASLKANHPDLLPFFESNYEVSSDKKLSKHGPEEISLLHKKRLEFLSLERQANERHFPERKKTKIAIIGGGPAGLMRALYAIHLGYSVTLLEKRDGTYSRESGGRPNTLHLGHGQLNELSLLIHYGIFDRLLLAGTLLPSIYGGYIVSICDLEKEMASLVKEWQPEAFVPSVSGISIIPSTTEKTTIAFKNQKIEADLLFLCVGSNSDLGKNLGLTHASLTHTVHAPIGFFFAEEGTPQKVFHVAQALFSTLKDIPTLASSSSKEELLKHFITKGILFRKEKEDYVGISLTEQDEKVLKEATPAQKEALLREKLETRHREMDLFLSIFKPEEHSVRSAHLVDAKLIPIQLRLAETPLFTIGKTLFLPRGDFHGSTHPAAGYGAKAAIASLKAEEQFLPYYDQEANNPIFIELYLREAERTVLLSQEKGMEALQSYRKNFEKPALFISLAKERESPFSSLALSPLLRLYYIHNWRPLTKEEVQTLHELKKTIVLSVLSNGFHSITCQEQFAKGEFPLQIVQNHFSYYRSFVKEEAILALNPFEKAPPGTAELLRTTAMLFYDTNKFHLAENIALFGLVATIEAILGKNPLA